LLFLEEKGNSDRVAFSLPGTGGLFVFMTHLLAELSVFVLGNLFPAFLYHTAHSMQPPFGIFRGK